MWGELGLNIFPPIDTPNRKMKKVETTIIEKKNPYDTQYAAHLYEWDLDELRTEVENIGFQVDNVFGLYAKKRKFDKLMEDNELYQKFKEYLPTPFLMSFFPVIYPEYADEVVLILTKPE